MLKLKVYVVDPGGGCGCAIWVGSRLEKVHLDEVPAWSEVAVGMDEMENKQLRLEVIAAVRRKGQRDTVDGMEDIREGSITHF